MQPLSIQASSTDADRGNNAGSQGSGKGGGRGSDIRREATAEQSRRTPHRLTQKGN